MCHCKTCAESQKINLLVYPGNYMQGMMKLIWFYYSVKMMSPSKSAAQSKRILGFFQIIQVLF